MRLKSALLAAMIIGGMAADVVSVSYADTTVITPPNCFANYSYTVQGKTSRSGGTGASGSGVQTISSTISNVAASPAACNTAMTAKLQTWCNLMYETSRTTSSIPYVYENYVSIGVTFQQGDVSQSFPAVRLNCS